MHTRTAQRRLVALLALLIVYTLPSLAAAQIPQFARMYVFGDSLADNGNILIQSGRLGIDPPVPPSSTPHRTYFDGRFSNGYIGVEYLWQRLTGRQPGSSGAIKPFLAARPADKDDAIDFAFGGTGTPYLDQTPGGFWAPGLLGQVQLFRLAIGVQKPDDRALYVIVTGANDYRVDPYNVPMSPAEVVGNIEQAITTLYRLGARHVMVLDLPDLGLVPANGGDPAASAVSAAHNAALDEALAGLQTRYPRLHLIPVKLGPLFQDLLSRLESRIPAIEVFAPQSPGMSACLFINPATCQDLPASVFNANLGFLFWDIIHATTEAHFALGEYLYEQLAGAYE